MKRALHPTRKTEQKLRLLVGDLGGDMQLYGLSMAIMEKLTSVRLMYSLCRKAAENVQKVYHEEKQSLRPGVVSGVSTLMTYAAAYFEAFLYFITGALDVLAGITVHLYPKHQRALSRRAYFKDQMNKTFLKHPNIAPEYAKLLSSNRPWLEDVQNNRDALAHKASTFLAFEADRVVFEKRKPWDDRDPLRKKLFDDLLEYLDATLESLYGFLEGYVEIHRPKVPLSDRSRVFLKSLEEGRVYEYIPNSKGCG